MNRRASSFALAAILVGLTAAGVAVTAEAEPSRTEQPRRAADLSYPDINPNSPTHGSDLQLSTLWADRGIVLSFIASWCHFCWEELPEFQELHAGEVAPFVGIAADEHDDPGRLIEMVARANVTMPVLLVPADEIGEVERQYSHGVLPATYVIDRRGRIAALFQGMASRDVLLTEIENHLQR